MLLIGLTIIGFIVFVVYKPMYSVSLNGEFIGYTEDKGRLQKKLNDYIKSGDNNTVAFVEIDNLPEYNLCLLQKGLNANDDEIFSNVISTGVPYYKYYAITDNNEEKYYVQSYEEADAIINELKSKNSKNQETVTYTLKYGTELKQFTDQATAVSGLYQEMPVVKKRSKVVTSKNVDYSNTALDIATSSGTPIKAASSGRVIYSGYKGSYGYLVIIEHTDSVQTYYAHCSRLYVNVGQTVNQGDTIAAVGSTGNSTGPHLHLEIRVNGVAKNPQNYVY